MTKTIAEEKVADGSSGRKYKVTLYTDGTVWCECQAMKFQKNVPAEQRSCKHTKRYWPLFPRPVTATGRVPSNPPMQQILVPAKPAPETKPEPAKPAKKRRLGSLHMGE